MNGVMRWMALPVMVAMVVGVAGQALGQPISVSPGGSAVQVHGTSGGTQRDKACAGYLAASPNHLVQVTEDSNLRFTLQGSGHPVLLIRSGAGQVFCVPADDFSKGKVEIPGRWSKGTYAVYVGDRAGEQHPYTLSISSH